MQPNHTMIYKCLSRIFVYLMTLTFWNLFYEKNISSFMTVLSCSLLMASCSNADNSLKNDENKQSSINVDANTIQKPSAQKSSFDVKVGLMSSSTGNAPLIFIDEKGAFRVLSMTF